MIFHRNDENMTYPFSGIYEKLSPTLLIPCPLKINGEEQIRYILLQLNFSVNFLQILYGQSLGLHDFIFCLKIL